jgi:leucyl aminopeptidase
MTTLALTVHPPGTPLSEGTSVRMLADARAVLRLSGAAASVDVALPACSVTETRWIVDKLIRELSDVIDIDAARLRAAPSVADDTALTLALDLHHRTRGRLDVEFERSAVVARLARTGDLEDGFRAWVNEDSSARTSHAIARDVRDWASGRDDVEVDVLTEPELTELGLRLLLSVGQGSEVSPPRLVVARWFPRERSANPLMLLGKGITFDTGGINLKPYESFVSTMKNDMAGAALAFQLFRALVEADHPDPVVLVIPTCENAIGARSVKPGAIVESFRGIRVRIDHTDAEGRLILADALAWAADRFEPSQILCFATLTTAALISYGPYATPVHFPSPELQAKLAAASEALGEDLHFFPERVWHFEANRDKEADLRNTARLPADAARGAGSRNAAHFLKHFTDRPLCHFDIFASTWNWAGDAPGAGYGATGAPLRTLLRAFGVC